jgi:hypothetical protein
MRASTDETAASTSGPLVVPAGLPVLSRYRHRGPTQGACVMEYTSLLAGLRFSDRPRCTHPGLGELARQVNDRVTDTARPQLATRASALARIGPHIPGVAAAIGAAAHQTSTRLGPASSARAWHRRVLRGLRRRDTAGRSWWGRRCDAAIARQLVWVALDHIAALPGGPLRDRALIRLLDRAITEATTDTVPTPPEAVVAAASRGDQLGRAPRAHGRCGIETAAD